MKTILALAVILSSSVAFALGQDRGNGGDMYSREFVAAGYDILQRLSISPIPNIDMPALGKAVMTTVVNSKENLTLNGYEVDAINYPDAVPPRIEVNRAAWDRMKERPQDRIFLVLHEYLGILKIDDSSYQLSRQIDQAQICSRSPDVRIALEDYFNISCDRILIQDLQQIQKLQIYVRPGTNAFLVDDFKYLYNMERLKINPFCRDNCSPFTMPSGIFKDQKSLQYLSIFGMQSIVSHQLEGAIQLKQAHLSLGVRKNYPGPLGDIEPDAFDGLNLDLLIISGNIKSIQPDAFRRGIKSLVVADSRWDYDLPRKKSSFSSPDCVNSTSLEMLPDGAFRGLEATKKLDLSCLSANSIGDNVWKDLPNLKSLFLSASFGGGIVKRNALQNLPSLETLSIGWFGISAEGQGYISKIEDGAFDGLKITDLRIRTVLTNTNAYVFSPLTHLTNLQMVAIDLEHLPQDFFSKFPALSDLYLWHDTKVGFKQFNLEALGFEVRDYENNWRDGESAYYIRKP